MTTDQPNTPPIKESTAKLAPISTANPRLQRNRVLLLTGFVVLCGVYVGLAVYFGLQGSGRQGEELEAGNQDRSSGVVDAQPTGEKADKSPAGEAGSQNPSEQKSPPTGSSSSASPQTAQEPSSSAAGQASQNGSASAPAAPSQPNAPSPATQSGQSADSGNSTAPDNADLEQRVIQKLGKVPVFTIASPEGQLLTASVQTEQDDTSATVAPIFMDPQDAQAFLNQKQQESSALADVQVTPLPLSEVYRLQKENKDKAEPLVFQFFPKQKQVESAIALLQQEGQDAEQFNGVPLFVARTEDKQGLLVVQMNDQAVIPFFFSKEQLEGFIERAKQEQPNLELGNVQIGVISLAKFVDRLLTNADPQLNQMELIAPQATVEYIRSQQQ